MNHRGHAVTSLLLPALLGGCIHFRGFAEVGPLEEQTFQVDRGSATEADVQIAFYAGRIDVAPADTDTVLSLTARDNLEEVGPRIVEQREGSHLHARAFIEGDKSPGWSDDGERIHEWEVRLGTRLPLALRLGLVACEGEVELGGVPLRQADIMMSAGTATLRFSQPNPVVMERLEIDAGAGQMQILGLGNARCRSFQIEAGAGDFTIDCSGEWTESAVLAIEAGMCSVEILVPDGLAVRIDAEGAVFADVEAVGFRADGDEGWITAGFEAGSPQLVIRLDASFGAIRIVRS